ncbi:MAG: AtpZ/AtpI family protein [Alphaproteobacteria bacterium]
MTPAVDDGDDRRDADRAMQDAVRQRERRRDFWEKTGERSLGRNLAMIGALGWLVVLPTLGGVALGRWLDDRYGTGIFWTGALIVAGVAVGSWLAWRRMGEK